MCITEMNNIFFNCVTVFSVSNKQRNAEFETLSWENIFVYKKPYLIPEMRENKNGAD